MSAVTLARITTASGDALTRLNLELQLENQKIWEEQTATQKALMQSWVGQANMLATKEQEWFASLYRECLSARKQSLTTTSSDTTLQDVVRDALFMAQSIWPEYKAMMLTLQAGDA